MTGEKRATDKLGNDMKKKKNISTEVIAEHSCLNKDTVSGLSLNVIHLCFDAHSTPPFDK